MTRPLALITGASSGIGAAFAEALASRGYDLVLVARREDRLAQLAAAVETSNGIGAEALAADLATDAGVARVAERISRADLDLLVNNAGFGIAGPFFRSDVHGQEQMHRLHVLATVRLTHAALAGMVARGKGAVINVSSVAGFWQAPGSVSYCATKAWMNSFSKGLALELKAAGSPVQVQALCPGFTVSEFHDVAGIDRKTIPARFWMTAEVVVAESLRGLETREVLVVPGWQYRLLAFLMKHLPGALLDRAAIRQRRNMNSI